MGFVLGMVSCLWPHTLILLCVVLCCAVLCIWYRSCYSRRSLTRQISTWTTCRYAAHATQVPVFPPPTQLSPGNAAELCMVLPWVAVVVHTSNVAQDLWHLGSQPALLLLLCCEGHSCGCIQPDNQPSTAATEGMLLLLLLEQALPYLIKSPRAYVVLNMLAAFSRDTSDLELTLPCVTVALQAYAQQFTPRVGRLVVHHPSHHHQGTGSWKGLTVLKVRTNSGGRGSALCLQQL